MNQPTHSTRALFAGAGTVFLLGLPAAQAGPLSGPLSSSEPPAPVRILGTPIGVVQDDSLAFDTLRLLEDLRILAHDSMEGRRTGTEGGARALRFLTDAFARRGLDPVRPGGPRTREFPLGDGAQAGTGTNVLGMIQGTDFPDRYIVVSAHYDHLGVRGSDIYNGADDNASGVAALLALAEAFGRTPPRHSLLLVAFDAEEMGLLGARAFVADPPVPLESIVLNVNLDMLSRSDARELYVAGTHHYPELVPFVEAVAQRAEVRLLPGHDTPDLFSGDDWTTASDHAAFHRAGIPFLYFGVEDHEGYHRPSDTYENITEGFYIDAVHAIADFVHTVDSEPGGLH